MKVVIQNYCQEYEKEVVDLWNRTLTADPVTIKKFRKQVLFDDNFDIELCLVAMEGGHAVGFLLATKRKVPYLEGDLEPTRGWINVMFVDYNHQKKGIGEKLIKLAETKLKAMGSQTVILGFCSPNYFFPGIDRGNYAGSIEFFEKMGYKSGHERYSMCKDLHGYKISEESLSKLTKAQEAGFYFINFEYKYALELLEFLKNEFDGGWKRNALVLMQNDTAEDCILLALNSRHEITGFCMRMMDGNPMRFGPIGVMEDARNYGIGGILLDIMQFEMEKRGIYHMYFLSTDEPGRRFYERHGLKVLRTFVDYAKTML